MNIGDIARIRTMDDARAVEFIHKESRMPRAFTPDEATCALIGYHAGLNQVQAEMIRLDEEMGAALNPEKEE